jgi:hypothetical protein
MVKRKRIKGQTAIYKTLQIKLRSVLSYFVRLILSGNLYTVLKLVEQELPTLPEHLSSPAVFSGVRDTRS